MKKIVVLTLCLVTPWMINADETENQLMQELGSFCKHLHKPEWSENLTFAAESYIEKEKSWGKKYKETLALLEKKNPNFLQSDFTMQFNYKRDVPLKSIVTECNEKVAAFEAGLIRKVKKAEDKLAQQQAEEKSANEAREKKELLKAQLIAKKDKEMSAIASSLGYDHYLLSFRSVRQKISEGMSIDDLESYLIFPEEDQSRYTVNNLVEDYVIYNGSDHATSTRRQIAVKKESGKHYEKHTELPKTYYAVVDTKEFKTLLGSKKQVLVYEAIDESGSSGGSMSLVLLTDCRHNFYCS